MTSGHNKLEKNERLNNMIYYLVDEPSNSVRRIRKSLLIMNFSLKITKFTNKI